MEDRAALATADSKSRVIQPPSRQGILVDEQPFSLENIDALAEALRQQSEGRLEELRQTAELVEERLRQQAAEGRARIEQAFAVTKESIDRQLAEADERAADMYRERQEAGLADGHREGFEKGYAEGLEAGIKEGRAEAESQVRAELGQRLESEAGHLVAALTQLIDQVERHSQELFFESRADVVRLAMGAAATVIRRTVKEAPETVVETLNRALERLAQQHQLQVEVNSQDFEAVHEHLSGLAARLAANNGVSGQCSDDIERGGCRVHAGASVVDMTLGTQLEVLERRLMESGGVSQ